MALRIDVITLFPRMVEGAFSESLIGKARLNKRVDIRVHDLRNFTDDRHHTADDRPYGGGPGMVLKPEPLVRALKAAGAGSPLKGKNSRSSARRPVVIYLSPQGQPLTQALADRLAGQKRLVALAGHYEGIDERVMDWVDMEVSIGDVVLTGGEIPAMALVDAVVRQLPGVVKTAESLTWDSFAGGCRGGLDCPHYTRPAVWRGREVPGVLLSGDHGAVRRFREDAARRATTHKRPDLLKLKRPRPRREPHKKASEL